MSEFPVGRPFAAVARGRGFGAVRRDEARRDEGWVRGEARRGEANGWPLARLAVVKFTSDAIFFAPCPECPFNFPRF